MKQLKFNSCYNNTGRPKPQCLSKTTQCHMCYNGCFKLSIRKSLTDSNYQPWVITALRRIDGSVVLTSVHIRVASPPSTTSSISTVRTIHIFSACTTTPPASGPHIFISAFYIQCIQPINQGPIQPKYYILYNYIASWSFYISQNCSHMHKHIYMDSIYAVYLQYSYP